MGHFMINLLNRLIPYYMSLDFLSSIPGNYFLQYEIRLYATSGTTLSSSALNASIGSVITYSGTSPTFYIATKK